MRRPEFQAATGSKIIPRPSVRKTIGLPSSGHLPKAFKTAAPTAPCTNRLEPWITSSVGTKIDHRPTHGRTTATVPSGSMQARGRRQRTSFLIPTRSRMDGSRSSCRPYSSGSPTRFPMTCGNGQCMPWSDSTCAMTSECCASAGSGIACMQDRDLSLGGLRKMAPLIAAAIMKAETTEHLQHG